MPTYFSQDNLKSKLTYLPQFFDDIAGLESRQILQYAARAIELSVRFTDENLEEAFLKRLSLAQSLIHDPTLMERVSTRYIVFDCISSNIRFTIRNTEVMNASNSIDANPKSINIRISCSCPRIERSMEEHRRSIPKRTNTRKIRLRILPINVYFAIELILVNVSITVFINRINKESFQRAWF